MRLSAPAVAVLALAAACGKGSEAAKPKDPEPACRRLAASASGPGDVDGLFPFVEGNVWFHHLSTDTVSLTVRTVIGAPQVLDGATAYPRTMRGVDEATFPSTRWYSSGPGGVTMHANPGALPPTSLAFPHVAVRWPLVEGDSYETFGCTDLPTRAEMDGDGEWDRYDVTQVVTVGPVEDIEAYFGTIDARKISTVTRYVYRLSGGGTVETEEREDAWYAPGIGRLGSLGTRTGGGLAVTIADLLSGYAVGGVREGLQALETLAAPAFGAPAIAVGAGGALVAAAMEDGGGPYLGGFSLGADGLLGDVLGLMDAGEVAPRAPAVSASAAGFLVAQGYADGVRYGRFAPDGARLDPAAGLALAPDAGVTETAVASDGAGFGLLWSGDDGVRFGRVGAGGEVLGVQALAAGRGRAPAVAWVGGRYLAMWIGDDGRLHVAPVDALGEAGAEVVVDLGDVRGFAASADGDDVHATWLDGSRTVRTARLAADGALDGDTVATLFEGRDIDAAFDLRLGFDGANHVATWTVFSLDGLRTGAHAAAVSPAGVPVAIHGGTSAKLAPYGEHAVALPATGGETRLLWKRGDRFQIGTFAF